MNYTIFMPQTFTDTFHAIVDTVSCIMDYGFDIFNYVKSDLNIKLYQPKKVVIKVKVLPLKRLYPYRKPRWAEVGQTYI